MCREFARYFLLEYSHGFHAATLGMNSLVAHLNANDGLTGEVLPRPYPVPGYVLFRPDGWPLPLGVHPEGFMVRESLLLPADADQVQPVRYATPWHEALSRETALQLVREYLEEANPWAFISTTRDAALSAVEGLSLG